MNQEIPGYAQNAAIELTPTLSKTALKTSKYVDNLSILSTKKIKIKN